MPPVSQLGAAFLKFHRASSELGAVSSLRKKPGQTTDSEPLRFVGITSLFSRCGRWIDLVAQGLGFGFQFPKFGLGGRPSSMWHLDING